MSKDFDVEIRQSLAAAWREVMVDQRYRHYKGDEYTVVRISVNEADGVVLATYVSEKQPGYEWTRTIHDFFSVTEGVARFVRIPKEDE